MCIRRPIASQSYCHAAIFTALQVNHYRNTFLLRIGGTKTSAAANVEDQQPLQLPLELLTLIFSELQQLDRSPTPSAHARSWLSVTWVCRYWREVALSTPALWSSICSGSACKPVERAWVETALARSGRMPLDIDVIISDYGERAPSFLALMFVHAQNIRVLRLGLATYSPCRGSMQRFFELMAPTRLSMPFLEELNLRDSVWGFADFHRPYLSHLTREHVPRLRILSLTDVNFPWSSSLYSSLSYLSLDAIPSPPTIMEFLQILRACPTLRKLRVNDALPEDDLVEQPLPRDTSIVALPCLKSMYLAGEYAVLAYILDLLEVPYSCDASIEYTNTIESTQPVGLISAVLPRPHAFWEVILYADYLALQYESMEGYGKSFASLEIGTNGGQDWLIHIDSERNSDANMDPSSWQELLHTFRSAPLTRVYIFPVDPIRSDMWVAFFHQFPLLHTIELGPERGFLYKENRKEYMRHGIKPFFHALCSSGRDSESEDIYVPNLRVLAMNILVVDTDIAAGILLLLEKRKAMCKPVERLEFRDCVCQVNIGREEFVSQLKHAGVAHVVTDGGLGVVHNNTFIGSQDASMCETSTE
ncbi:hypothetical protein GY45DRAFT_1341004 [Cubamyces sp. BRFM 1775]|nr:hypothetical protein GY45DRAFT_1341004 [Cubamyces sp. BRFM 1775]